MWRHAAALVASGRPEPVVPKPGAQLSSSLQQELCAGAARLQLLPGCMPAQVPEFLAATGLSELIVDSDSSMQSAHVNAALPACTTIRGLHCFGSLVPEQLPATLAHLRFMMELQTGLLLLRLLLSVRPRCC